MKWIWATFFLLFVVLFGLIVGQVGEPDTTNTLAPPSIENWLGTDALGRDLGLRLLMASALSLLISGLAWFLALIAGIAIGSTAAYLDDTFLSNSVEEMISVVYSTPFLIILVGILGLMGPGIANAYLVLLLFAWAAPARHSMTIVRHLKKATYVRAALAFGFRPKDVIRVVIIPEVFPTVLIASLAVLPEILALDVALSFFGLGAQPPTPTIGGLIVDGLNYGFVAWWMAIFPTLGLSFLCIALRIMRFK